MKLKNILKYIFQIVSNFIIDDSSYKTKNFELNNSIPQDKEKALFEILNFINNNNFDYFLSGGTLLGIYRDGKLIDWDDDIDIDIFSYSYRSKFNKLLEYIIERNYPFKIGPNYFHPKITIYLENTKVSLVAISRGFFKRNYLYRSKYRVPYKFCRNCIKIKIKNEYYGKVPYKTEDYLKYLYGTSWEKPIRWKDDDNNEFYNLGYIRNGKRYMLLDHFQILLSKMIYIFVLRTKTFI